MELKKKELAEVFGVSPKTLDTYIRDGMPGRRGSAAATRYALKEALPWFVSLQIDQARKGWSASGSPQQLDPEALSAEKLYWEMEATRHKTLKLMRELVSIDDATALIERRLTPIRDALNQVPALWAPFLVGLPDLPTAQKLLNEQLDELYQTLSSLPDVEIPDDEDGDDTGITDADSADSTENEDDAGSP